MITNFRPACLALGLVVMAGPACAQSWVYEPDNGVRVYPPPGVYQDRYVTRAYNAYAYEPVVTAPAVPVARTRRTVVNRTIIPQGRGRGPIVREHIVSETTTPVVRSTVVTRPAVEAYAYAPGEVYAPAPRVVTRPVVVDYAARATDGYALAADPVVAVPVVRPYRYYNDRALLVDPVTGVFLSDINR